MALAVVALGLLRSAQADDVTDLNHRDRLFQELADDVDSFEQGNLLKKAVRLAQPSVVHIAARRPRTTSARGSGKPLEEAGSGVVIAFSNRHFVLTNRHVVHEAELTNIDVVFADGSSLRPINRWADEMTDVAVLEIDGNGLIPARVGDSESVEIGDFVLAVGSPFGLSHSVTYGIISAKGRRDLDLGDGKIRYQNFMQTDAAINPGNSGGPLLNLRGEVIGINTAIASSSGGSEGIGFTIPIAMAVSVARQLVERGRPMRAYLGVNLNPNFGPEDAVRLGLLRPRGAHVRSITAGSPAAEALIRANDVVVEFDGRPIDDDHHLIQVVGFTQVGKEVEVTVFRGGKLIRLKVSVQDRSRFEAS
jgi:serine protease Do